MIGSMGTSVIPILGFTKGFFGRAIPYMGIRLCQTTRMKPREVLAANFQKLREVTPELKELRQIVAAGGGSNGSLDRIYRALTATNVDSLEPLAAAYGLEPWQLLDPSLQVKKGKFGKPVVVTSKPGHDLSVNALEIANMFDAMSDGRKRLKALMICIQMMQEDQWPDAKEAESPSSAPNQSSIRRAR